VGGRSFERLSSAPSAGPPAGGVEQEGFLQAIGFHNIPDILCLARSSFGTC